jgi:class I fructose-bisphosphate aldolase
MNIGKLVRLNRLFSHPSGRLCSIAVDHFIGYQAGIPDGLRRMEATVAAIAAARPDAVTMYRGTATTIWKPYAGKVPMIIQAIIGRPDDSVFELLNTPEDVVRLGADAIAISAFLRGPTEGDRLRRIADCVRQAARFELPVICHVYPRDEKDLSRISFAPEDVAWVVRCATELGVDVIKAPYCGDVAAHAQIVAECPLPLVAAGGPKQETLAGALAMMVDVVKSGARGATIGRNVWSFPEVTKAVLAFKAVIHDEMTAEEAMRSVGLGERDK